MTLPFVIMGCQDETERITLDSPQDTMGLKVSSSDVVLNQDLGNEEAISFTWGSAANRGEGTKLHIIFKMDMADNNFETSIAKVEIPEGVQSISLYAQGNERFIERVEGNSGRNRHVRGRNHS